MSDLRGEMKAREVRGSTTGRIIGAAVIAGILTFIGVSAYNAGFFKPRHQPYSVVANNQLPQPSPPATQNPQPPPPPKPQ